jgi:serine/threonine-protein kinase RsbW
MTPAGTSPTNAARPPTAAPCEQVFPARPDQVREARRSISCILDGHPAADDAVLCVSEMAANAILHSNSRKPGGQFTVRAEIYPGDRLRIEVHDQGGSWARPIPGEEQRGHGLHIISQLARTWGITGDGDTGWTVWAVLDSPPPGPPPPASRDAATVPASDPTQRYQSPTPAEQ